MVRIIIIGEYKYLLRHTSHLRRMHYAKLRFRNATMNGGESNLNKFNIPLTENQAERLVSFSEFILTISRKKRNLRQITMRESN